MNKVLFFSIMGVFCFSMTANFLCSEVALPQIRIYQNQELAYESSDKWEIKKENEAYRLRLPFNIACLAKKHGSDRVWIYSKLLFSFRRDYFMGGKWILNVFFFFLDSDPLECGGYWKNIARYKAPKNIEEHVDSEYGIDIYLNRTSQLKKIAIPNDDKGTDLNSMKKIVDLYYEVE